MMESAFAWLKYIAEWIGQFIPRWEVVDTSRGWVKWVRGKKVVTGGAGVIWHWPLMTKFQTWPTARQTTPLPTQVITTTDDIQVAISGMVVYEVFDLERLLAHTYDAEDTVRDIAQTSLLDVCTRLTYQELRKGQGRTLDTRLRNEAKKDLEDFGVRVLKFTLSTCARTKVYRVMQSTFTEGEIPPPGGTQR